MIVWISTFGLVRILDASVQFTYLFHDVVVLEHGKTRHRDSGLLTPSRVCYNLPDWSDILMVE